MCRQPYQAYTFSDLPYVTQLQQQYLANYSVANPSIAPQAILAASEQGWATSSPELQSKMSACEVLFHLSSRLVGALSRLIAERHTLKAHGACAHVRCI